MNNLPLATLSLRTSDASVSNFNTNWTWNNINLRVLLGDLYDKYNKFNLVLSAVSSNPVGNTVGTTTDDLSVFAVINGLPWLNQSYYQPSGHHTANAVLTPINFVRGSAYFSAYDSSILTFSKNQESVNLNIYLIRIDGIVLLTPVDYPDCFFVFKIYGVDEYNPNLLSQRMIK